MKIFTTLLTFIFIILISCVIVAQNNPLPAGTYTIGSGGDFPTIDSAFTRLNVDGISGPVTLELIDTLYTAPTDSGFFLKGPIPGAGPDSRVTIKPAVDKNVTVEGNDYALQFSNVSYLTLDGVGLTGSTTLTAHALGNPQAEYNAAVDFIHNSDHNIIQNITAFSDDFTRTQSSGISVWENVNSSNVPDSNLIKNNFIKKAGIAINIGTTSSTYSTGNIIKDNILGSALDSLMLDGILVKNTKNTIVEGNKIENIKIEENIVKNLKIDINNNATAGIISYNDIGNIIRNNVVHNIKSLVVEAIGILVMSPSSSANKNLIYNNMVYDIQSLSKQFGSSTSGIFIWNQSNPQIYYNTVYLNGTGNGTNLGGSFAFWIYSSCTNVVAKDNIFVNSRDESPSIASSIYDYTSSNLISDNNDLFYMQNQYNSLVRIGGTKYNNLAAWQAKGEDVNSITEMPNFKAPYLHIDESIPTNLEKRAAPIAVVNTDFDGDLRDVNLPDIGADEFNGQVPSGPMISGYSVGTKGYFPTIDSAFNRLSVDGISGPVTLELIDTLYTAPTDSGFFLKGPIPGAGPKSRVTIKPAANKNVTVEGNDYGLQFSNVSYLTLDGVGLTGSTTLTAHALGNPQAENNAAVYIVHNSNHNIVQNITAFSDDYTRPQSFGIAVLEIENSSNVPDSNLIQNNFIKKAGIGIRVVSASSTHPTGNIIKDNILGSALDSLMLYGIVVRNTKNTIVEGNKIENIKIEENIVKNLKIDVNNNATAGIISWNDIGDIIRNNVVHNIKSLFIEAIGILVASDPGQSSENNLIYNNMVYDIQSISKQPGSSTSGIFIWNQSSPQIYYNTVYLNGTGNGTNLGGSAAFWIDNSCTNVVAKDNIFVNNRDESPYTASSIYDYTYSNLTSDNNDLFDMQNQYNTLVRISSTKYNTLSAWQAKGEDVNSITEMPNFKTPYLHIDESIPTNIESHGTPIAGIVTDFDGEKRNADSTDIGADEFNGAIIVGVDDKAIQPLSFNLDQNYPNPFNPSTTIKYSIPKASFVTLKVYDILGREITTLVNKEQKEGVYKILFNSNNLSSGVYFYRITTGNFVSTKKFIILK